MKLIPEMGRETGRKTTPQFTTLFHRFDFTHNAIETPLPMSSARFVSLRRIAFAKPAIVTLKEAEEL